MMAKRTGRQYLVPLGKSVGWAAAVLLGLALYCLGSGGMRVQAQQGTGIIRVAMTGSDTPDCGSVAQPCRTVQYAVDLAEADDEVHIASGVYSGVHSVGQLSQVVYVARPVVLRGGYSPDFTLRDILHYTTTLDAEWLGRVLNISGTISVTVEGLHLIHGNAAGQPTWGWSGHEGGGGIYIWQATALVSGTTIAENSAAGYGQGGGAGLFADNARLTLWNSTLRGNTTDMSGGDWGGGAMLWVSPATIEGNRFISNTAVQGGGLMMDQVPGLVVLRHNTFQGNQATSDGGALQLFAPVIFQQNHLIDNSAAGNGGGLYLRTYTGAGASTVDGNLFAGNAANFGGGLYLYQYYDADSGGTVDNNAFVGNSASTKGAGLLYVGLTNPAPFRFRHNTFTDHDDTAALSLSGGATYFTNTLFAHNTIAVETGSSGQPNQHYLATTFWDSNITNTVGPTGTIVLSGCITGNAALAADGYHLTADSKAIDVGIDAGVESDIDGKARPQCGIPDIGAEESLLCHGGPAGDVVLAKLADAPRAFLQFDPVTGEMNYVLSQLYAILVGNGLTSTSVATYTVTDDLPAPLAWDDQVHLPRMSFEAGPPLTWRSQSPLAPDEIAWIVLRGIAQNWAVGQAITNTATLHYGLSDGAVGVRTAEVAMTIPPMPPLITMPGNGEYALDELGNLQVMGLARPGATVVVFEDDVAMVTTTASITGTFFGLYDTTHLTTTYAITLTAREYGAGGYSAPSNSVWLIRTLSFWCPQRSVWKGPTSGLLAGLNLRYPFRDSSGLFTTAGWIIPGVQGFQDTAVQLFVTNCPGSHERPEEVLVVADGVTYTAEPISDTYWYAASIDGGAHEADIVGQCLGLPPIHGGGVILIDPDGYVFNVDQGFDPLSPTLHAVSGVTVTCMVSMTEWGGWVPWPAHLYNEQVNPQVTDENGYFAFFTPPGHYYLQVSGIPGYQDWRSPVVEVISEVVHVNVPYTPWADGGAAQVVLTPSGPDPSTIVVELGGSVEWLSAPAATGTITDLVRLTNDPVLQPRTWDELDPLSSTLGLDGGRLAPGQAYRRQFNTPGLYGYSDGAGHWGWVVVGGSYRVYLPLLARGQ
jgi:hypothetical protein